jgi:glycosyltransferase
MLVSIITLTYNSANTIEKTLKSIKKQKYKNIEMVFIDNLSSDGTLEILNKYVDEKTKFVSEKDKSITDAFNKGLEMSTGDIVGFLHSDDVFCDEDCVHLMVESFKNNRINFFYANLNYVSKQNKLIRFWKADKNQGYKEKNYLKKKINFGWMPPHPTVYIKRNLIELNGRYNEKYSVSFDYDYLLRLIKNNSLEPFYLDKTFINMTTGGNSNSMKNILKKMIEDYLIIKENLKKGILVLFLKNIRKLNQFFFIFKKNQ